MATGLICIRWISPDEIGLWQIMILIEGYLLFARFGIINALNRELPFSLGRNRLQKAMKYLDVTEWYVLAVCILFFVGLLGSIWFYNPLVDNWQICIVVLSVYFPVKFYSGFLEMTYRSGVDFKNLAKVQVSLVFFTVITMLLVYLYGFEGYLARTVILVVIG